MVVWLLLVSVAVDILPLAHNKALVTLGEVCRQGKLVEAACHDAGVQAEGYEHRLRDFRLKAESRSSEHFSLNTFSLST
jgi:hypothetical protein